ncbi:HAD family phosphatase [Halorubellus sp. JP-L1]|uniref:HAD family hydrolase n=1 Tax=Halorubellus sp. JP-L1 TaxID=2715753 RepID=UPI00140B45AB|nr:HAD family phosphatase [Halorubellus sp. JP-L1]NHN43101.1 HAD family phosphatase [Halorubellus sp. JP-L1]
MDACCFDMDGVVVDSERHWVPLENDRILPTVVEATDEDGNVAGSDRGGPTASEITGMNVRDIYEYLDREYGTTVDEDGFVAEYDEAAVELYEDRVELVPGFEALVDDLRAAGTSVALVSSSPHRWIDRVLERFDLANRFDAVVSAEDVDGPSKPEPAVYEAAARRLGVDPARAIAIEDSRHGIAAANAAGMHAVAYRTEANADVDLSAAATEAEGPEALRETLLSLARDR